jgi:hypothetical protein
MHARRRFKRHEKTFTERLGEEMQRLKEAADQLPRGSQARELLLERIRKVVHANNVNAWMQFSGVRPPESQSDDLTSS